jgi:hypothetical protein
MLRHASRDELGSAAVPTTVPVESRTITSLTAVSVRSQTQVE